MAKDARTTLVVKRRIKIKRTPHAFPVEMLLSSFIVLTSAFRNQIRIRITEIHVISRAIKSMSVGECDKENVRSNDAQNTVATGER